MAGLFNLSGKTVLATGATKGIGQSMTLALAEAGADVIILQRDLSNTDTKTKVEALGRKCTLIQCDMSERERISEAVKEALSVSQVHVLLNSAGLQRRFPAEELSYEAWDDVQRTNLAAIFAMCREVGTRWLAEKRRGVIINVASLAAMQGGINMAAYAASKGGVVQLTKALSNEWSGRGIRVNCVSPGYIATDINKDVRTKPEYKANYDSITSRIPMGRWGDADDFKGVAVFMASDASAYMSGENLVIDGGWMAR